MTVGQMALLFLLIFTGACNAANDGPTDTGSVATPKDGFQEDPLSIATFGGDVFADSDRFAAYSFIANRVSVINTDQEAEIWGRHVSGEFKSVFPLPGVSVVGLVSESEFRVVGEGEELSFDMDIHLDRWRWARSARTAVFNDSSGLDATVVRNQPDGSWETLKINYPEKLKLTAVPAPLITNDGLTVVELFATAPAYVVYRATEAGAEMKQQLSCELDAAAFPDELSFSNAYSGGTNGRQLVVTFDTQLTVIDISEGAECADPKTLTLTDVVKAGPLRRVLFVDDQQAILASESGEVVGITLSEKGAVTVDQDYGKPCVIPAGLNGLSSHLLGITCATDFDGNSKVNEVALLIYDLKTSETLFKTTVALDKLAGVAVDSEGSKLFEILDGGLGELRITDLSSGSSRSVRGLFTNGILDNL